MKFGRNFAILVRVKSDLAEEADVGVLRLDEVVGPGEHGLRLAEALLLLLALRRAEVEGALDPPWGRRS